MNRKAMAFLIAASVAALDQLTKYLAAAHVSPYQPLEVLPFFRLVNVRNTGAAFGVLSGLGNAFFIAISVAALLLIAFLLLRGRDGFYSLCLILGGATGNLIDRVRYGYVRDFLDFSLGSYHWPAFNVADAALSVGIVIFIAGALLRHSPR
jgi:signal peptidase II